MVTIVIDGLITMWKHRSTLADSRQCAYFLKDKYANEQSSIYWMCCHCQALMGISDRDKVLDSLSSTGREKQFL